MAGADAAHQLDAGLGVDCLVERQIEDALHIELLRDETQLKKGVGFGLLVADDRAGVIGDGISCTVAAASLASANVTP